MLMSSDVSNDASIGAVDSSMPSHHESSGASSSHLNSYSSGGILIHIQSHNWSRDISRSQTRACLFSSWRRTLHFRGWLPSHLRYARTCQKLVLSRAPRSVVHTATWFAALFLVIEPFKCLVVPIPWTADQIVTEDPKNVYKLWASLSCFRQNSGQTSLLASKTRCFP